MSIQSFNLLGGAVQQFDSSDTEVLSLTRLPTAARIAGVPAWTNKDGCLQDNSAAAQVVLGVGETSGDLFVDNYDFSALPDPCKVVGVELLINRKAVQGGIRDNSLQLLDIAGDPAGDNKGNVIDVWPNGLVPYSAATYGGSGIMWGLALTRDWLVNANFGVRLKVKYHAGIGDNNANVRLLGEMTAYHTV